MFIYSILIPKSVRINACVVLSFSDIGFKILNSNGICNFEIEITRSKETCVNKVVLYKVRGGTKWLIKTNANVLLNFIYKLSQAVNGILKIKYFVS